MLQTISHQAPAIIVVLPLVVSFFVLFTGWWIRGAGFYMAVGALAVCAVLATAISGQVWTAGAMQYRIGGWPPPWGIEYRVDHLSTCMIMLICWLSLLTALHCNRPVQEALSDRAALFWCLFLLLTTGLVGIVLTADLFNLFVLLEVASLSGYALVAVGPGTAKLAGFRYLLMGTVGATFYLIGIGHLYIATGSLNMADLNQLLPPLYGSRVVRTAFLFMLFGIGIKSAVFPLHAWLPDAYTHAPSASAALIAPLMTKVMIYVAIRVSYTVFGPGFPLHALGGHDVLVWLGVAAIFFGAVTALAQTDVRRMLCYVIIAEIGFVVGGVGVANATAFKGAIFHIVNDAVMMACLFLVVGMVAYKTNGQRISDFRGLFRTMPLTAAIFVVGALAVIGVPPSGSFFSKWYLLLGAIAAGQWLFVAALLVCTLINAALFFRIIDRGLFASPVESVKPEAKEPLGMVLPAAVLAIAIVLLGLFNQTIIDKVIAPSIPPGI